MAFRNPHWRAAETSINNLLDSVVRTNLRVQVLYIDDRVDGGIDATLMRHVMKKSVTGNAPRHLNIVLDSPSATNNFHDTIKDPESIQAYRDFDSNGSDLFIGSHHDLRERLVSGSLYGSDPEASPTSIHNSIWLIDIQPWATVSQQIFMRQMVSMMSWAAHDMKANTTDDNRHQEPGQIYMAVILIGHRDDHFVQAIMSNEIPFSLEQISTDDLDQISFRPGQVPNVPPGYILLEAGSLLEHGRDAIDSIGVRRIRDSASRGVEEIPRLHTVVSRGTAPGMVMRDDLGQAVLMDVQLTRCELDRHKSWVLKSKTPDRVRFITDYSYEEYAARPMATAMTGTAWSREIRYLALELVRCFPRVHTELRRFQPVLPLALHEALHQLCISRCITEGQDQRYVITHLGQEMLNLLDAQNGDPMVWPAAAMRVMAEHNPDIKGNFALSVISTYLAHLISAGPGKICKLVKGTRIPDSVSHKFCAPAVQRYWRNGALWVALGVALADRVESVPECDWMTLDRELLGGIHEHIDQIIGHVEEIRQVAKTPLTSQELDVIDLALLWAFMHQIVLVRKVVDGTQVRFIGHDCVSMVSVNVTEPSHIDISAHIEAARHKISEKAIHMAYGHMELKGQRYVPKDLTLLSRKALTCLSLKYNSQWPLIVKRLYNEGN